MPIYVHECEEHGRQDFFSRAVDPVPERPCQECGKPAGIVVTAPARFDIERDWDETANLYQQNPYTQAKAQLENVRREQWERVERDCDRTTTPITEESIQLGAREIDKQNRRNQDDPTGEKAERRIVERQRRQMQKAKAEAKQKALQ